MNTEAVGHLKASTVEVDGQDTSGGLKRADWRRAKMARDPAEGKVLRGREPLEEVFHPLFTKPDLAAIGEDREDTRNVDAAALLGKEPACRGSEHAGCNGSGGGTVRIPADMVFPAQMWIKPEAKVAKLVGWTDGMGQAREGNWGMDVGALR